jgi:hypothetical protein
MFLAYQLAARIVQGQATPERGKLAGFGEIAAQNGAHKSPVGGRSSRHRKCQKHCGYCGISFRLVKIHPTLDPVLNDDSAWICGEGRRVLPVGS